MNTLESYTANKIYQENLMSEASDNLSDLLAKDRTKEVQECLYDL